MKILPTACLRDGAEGLEQRVQIVLEEAGDYRLEVTWPSGRMALPITGSGDVYLPELREPVAVAFRLWRGGTVVAEETLEWRPPRHLHVHLVQISHHDAGYTDLASHVLPQHAGFLDEIIDFAEQTADYPEAARFRAVIEQAWSLEAFLERAAPERAERLLALLRAGDVELGATFGNMTTELCDHETLLRVFYPAARLARRHGFRLRTAQHNDITGFNWGLASALTAAGVEFFAPGIPHYYRWGGGGLTQPWDADAILGRGDRPGAFWWQAPTGRQVLFWDEQAGCIGRRDPLLDTLPRYLASLAERGYPWDVVRLNVGGAQRDNSPYHVGYATSVRAWNEAWAWPKVAMSTDSRFWDALRPTLPADLPVWRGGMPGQDYPPGALSTSRATCVARHSQPLVAAAEAASVRADRPDLRATTDGASTALLWHCEHTWGHHFPAGPTAETAELEKALHAHRGETLAYDALRKSLATVADRVIVSAPDRIHLVVFNPTPQSRDDRVRQPLRELDNCGSELVDRQAGSRPGVVQMPVILNNRWPVHPPPDLAAGRFRLVDCETGADVPFQLLHAVDVPHAAARRGLAAGSRRYGFFDEPQGLAHDLAFIARDLPPLGWRSYRLEPLAATVYSPVTNDTAEAATTGARVVDAGRYQVRVVDGYIRELRDRELGLPLIDVEANGGTPHPFGALVVSHPDGSESQSAPHGPARVERGALATRLTLPYRAVGHPRVDLVLTLWHDLPVVELAACILKDSDPLLDVHLAMPFRLTDARMTVEDSLAVTDPLRDRLPGTFINRLAARDYVTLSNRDQAILWSSLDTPVFSPGRLWPSRVSPAHSAQLGDRCREPAQEVIGGSALYPSLFINNLGTNFACTQSGEFLFRFAFTTMAAGDATLAACHAFADRARQPLQAIYTKHPEPRDLPLVAAGLEIADRRLRLLAWKYADDGSGDRILRLWNAADHAVTSAIVFPASVAQIHAADLTETAESPLAADSDRLSVAIAAHDILTLRLSESADR